MQRREFLTAAGAMALSLPAAASAKGLPSDLTEMSALTLSTAIRKKKVSCREVMTAYLSRIERLNPICNAIVSLRDGDALLSEAADADAALTRGDYRGWMHGMPHAVKDLANVKGIPTSFGSPLFAGGMPAEDDVAIGRIRAEGAIFIGKTNTPEFGLGSQTYNPVFGATGCAYNPALTAGGSSGGAACALALHLVPVADGSDMMGSLRNPGAFNNVIGFRPSIGRVPSDPGDEQFYSRLGVSGPMGRNVEDAYRLLCTMAGAEAFDPLSGFEDSLDYKSFRPANLSGAKIGWLGDCRGYLAMEPGIIDLCEAGLRRLQEGGAIVEPADAKFDMARLWSAWLILRNWSRVSMYPLYDNAEKRSLLKPELIWEIERSKSISGADLHVAARTRSDWYIALDAMFGKFDFLALPTAQVFPFAKDVHWPSSINDRKMDTYHRWMEVVIGPTLAGLPTVNVPVGFDGQGRPMGMQLFGRYGADKSVLEFAAAYGELTDWLAFRPATSL